MSKVKTRKLKSSERADVEKRTKGTSEKDRTLKAIGKDKSKKKSSEKLAIEIVDMVDSKKKTKKDKDKTNKKSVSPKKVKESIKDMDMPKVLNTRHVTMLVEEMTGYSLGIDTTAGSKNLRRYLRTMPVYNDDTMTSYSWSVKDDDDIEELAEIISYYAGKVQKAN